MTKHRRETHYTFKPCRNIISCIFEEECVVNHDPIPVGLHRCFQCGNDYSSKNEMMIHRKNAHEGVKTCKNYLQNKCQRDTECWWKHDNNSEENLDFQQNPVNLAPPIAPIVPVPNWPHLPGQMGQTMPQMIQILEQNLSIMKNMWGMINMPTQRI